MATEVAGFFKDSELEDCVMVLDPAYRDGCGWLEEIEPPKRMICYREGVDDIEAKLRGFAEEYGLRIIEVQDRSK